MPKKFEKRNSQRFVEKKSSTNSSKKFVESSPKKIKFIKKFVKKNCPKNHQKKLSIISSKYSSNNSTNLSNTKLRQITSIKDAENYGFLEAPLVRQANSELKNPIPYTALRGRKPKAWSQNFFGIYIFLFFIHHKMTILWEMNNLFVTKEMKVLIHQFTNLDCCKISFKVFKMKKQG